MILKSLLLSSSDDLLEFLIKFCNCILSARERFRLLNITTVELRQVQISFYDAENRLYNALYQAKVAEAEIALLMGDITSF